MPEIIPDITSLGLLAFVLWLGYKIGERLTEGILAHLERQSDVLDECAESLQEIHNLLKKQDKN